MIPYPHHDPLTLKNLRHPALPADEIYQNNTTNSFSLLSDLFNCFTGSQGLIGFTCIAVSTSKGVTKNDFLLLPTNKSMSKHTLSLLPNS
jgi:hypothetical protein